MTDAPPGSLGHRAAVDETPRDRTPDLRPPVESSHYFLSTYRRFVGSLLVLAGVFVVLSREFFFMVLGKVIAAHIEHYPASPDQILQIVESKFPLWIGEAGLLENYVHIVAWLFTQPLSGTVLVTAGVVALVLQWRRGL